MLFTINRTNIRFIKEENLRWFRMKDITDFLGYNKSHNPRRFYEPRQDKLELKYFKVATLGGSQSALFVSEPDLYYLISHTQRPEIEKLMLVLGITNSHLINQLKRIFRSTKCYGRWVDGYWINIYIPKYNIVVIQDDDSEDRTEKIDSVMENPLWIKFKLDDPLVSIAANIVDAMLSHLQ